MNVKLTFVFKFFDLSASPLNKDHTIYNHFSTKQRTLYTVLRSPHIDKKSREQFEKQVYQQFVHLTLPLSKARAFFTSGPIGRETKSTGLTIASPSLLKGAPSAEPQVQPAMRRSLSSPLCDVHVKIRIHYKTYENK